MKTIRLLRPLGILLALATTASTAANGAIVQNGDFEAALSPAWKPKEIVPTGALTPPTAQITLVNGGTRGGLVLETTGRDHVQDGPMQGGSSNPTLKNALITAGNGRTYTTRVWVKLDASAADASFRCLLRWRNVVNGALPGNQQIPLILAEAVILQPGVWVQATSTATLTWPNSLGTVSIDFEVEQLHKGSSLTPPPQWFPSFQIDDLQMEIDTDGDGLWDSEESSDHAQSNLSFSDVVDSDGDDMPDDWEYAHRLGFGGLNARNAADASADPDGDGFTNVQEYFGATNPHDYESYPGEPCDPQATHLTRALLRYMALLPSSKTMLVGQMVENNATDYTAYVAGLATQTGRWPSMLGISVEKLDAPLDVAASIDHAIAFTNAGGIAQLKWSMWNPWRAHLYVQYGTIGTRNDLNNIDILGILDPAGTPTNITNTTQDNLDARAVMIGWIDTVATEIKRYNAATGSQPLLFRPLSEMNGEWFWFGHRTREEYLGLWNFIYDRLTGPASLGGHDLHNLIWIYESASSEHVHIVPTGTAAASDYYYPGDNRVDVMAHNLYDEDWVLSWDANKVYARYPKIYGVPQAGPEKSYPSRTGVFSNLIYPDQIAARYPRMSFFIVYNSFGGNLDDDKDNDPNDITNDDPYPLTLDDTHQHIAIFDNMYPTDLMTDTRVITRDELRWRPPSAPVATAASSTALAATWGDLSLAGQNETGFRLEVASAYAGPWSLAGDTAADATTATAGGLPAASTRWLRVRTLFPNGEDSLPTDPVSATTWSVFGQWKNDQLGDVNAPDTADDDADGLATALEYLLATDPLVASPAAQPTSGTLQLPDGESYLSVTFRRRIVSDGVSHEVQASSDLVSWLPDPVLTGTPLNHGDGTETVTYCDLIPLGSAPARFMRLRVNTP